MEYYHQWCLDEGASFAVLWPFRPDYYVKMGYGYGRKMNKYMFRPGDLPRGSKEGVRFMGADDVDAMHACFSDYGRGPHGMILKPKSFYERLFRRYKVVGYEKDGVIEGFIAFKFRKLWVYGLVKVSDESYVDTLDKLFHVARKPETIEEF